uniref:hypothetical protein n=1 Tax=Cellulomonas telluris TaxID=2306636 RepID=UPI0010A7F6C9
MQDTTRTGAVAPRAGMPPLARRSVLAGAALASVLPTVSGCAGLTRRVSATTAGRRDVLSVQVYGTDVEAKIYDQ